MPAKLHGISPYAAPASAGSLGSIRGAYIQNLASLLHVSLLNDDMERAYRAWSILIQCPEVDWQTRWHWGLDILESTMDDQVPDLATGRAQERYLKTLRVHAKERNKPTLLHALILHLIDHDRFSAALEELETYLSSYPYLTSATLHTYAGLISFYLARHRHPGPEHETPLPRESPVDTTSLRSSSVFKQQPPDASLMRSARGWLSKALELDPSDVVAEEFIRLIDKSAASDADSGKADSDISDDDDDDSQSDKGRSLSTVSE